MTRWTALALVVMCAALAGVGARAVIQVRQDRAELVARFGDDRLRQLEGAARQVEGDLADIGADLRFARQFIPSTESAHERRRELAALLGMVKQYRLLHVFDANGERLLSVRDPLLDRGFDEGRLALAMAEAAAGAADAADAPPDAVVTSTPTDGDVGDWFRVFAMALPGLEQDGRPGAVALLVDARPVFEKLRLVAAEPASHLLVLTARGGPAPMSGPGLVRAALAAERGEPVPAGFATLVDRMRAGASGTVQLADADSALLDLGAGGFVAAFTPIRVRGGGSWSAATVSSTAALRSHARAALGRLALTSGAIALCLVLFGAYVVVTTRRGAALRERLRHSDHLAHLHEKTEKILENIPAAVMVLSEGGVVTAVNRFLRDRVPDDVVARPLGAAFPDAPAATVARLVALVDAARAQGRVQALPGEQLAIFGAEGQYGVHAVPLEPGFPEARVVLVIEDLSQVHALESQLLRAEKLATVGVLAAGIAHEIGSPLGVIRGRAEYVLNKIGAGHGQAPSVRVIVDEIDHVTRTIRQLLDFARVRPAAVHAVDPARVVATVVELLRLEAARRKVTLAMDLPAALPPIAADPDQLQQVLVNLAMNAFDACRGGGTVTIRAAHEAAPPAAWARARLQVVDEGCGIPAEHRHQVFDPFFTTKKRGQGTGLGLAIAAQIVRNHGGQIELDSEPGRGTTVTVLWPAAITPEEHRHASG